MKRNDEMGMKNHQERAEILKSVLCVFHDTYCSKAALQKFNHKTLSKKDKVAGKPVYRRGTLNDV